LKLICQIFHVAYKIQQNFNIKNGVKTLEITAIFKGMAQILRTHKHGCRK